MLKEMGRQLDSDIYPIVKRGEVLTPGEPPSIKPYPGEKEEKNEKSGTRGPEAGQGEGTARGKGQAERGGIPDPEPSLVGPDLQVRYEGELEAVQEAYPGARVWRQPEGFWLLTESSLLPGLHLKAVFLTGIPFSRTRIVQSWGFWAGVSLKHPSWIGPRHTNFPHGSICAFDPGDRVWRLGDPIVHLLALYTLWAFRHLHLQMVGRWPGKQVAHIPYERITEFKADEFCGCDQFDRLYRDCCRDKDLSRDLLLAYNSYLFQTGGTRRPPASVVNFIRFQEEAPRLGDLLPEPALYPRNFLFRPDPCKRPDVLEEIKAASLGF